MNVKMPTITKLKVDANIELCPSRMVACLCHFVISFFRLFAWRYGAAPRRNNAKRKDEITKKRQAK